MGEKIIAGVVAVVVAWLLVTNTIDCYTGENGILYILGTVVFAACWLYAQMTKK